MTTATAPYPAAAGLPHAQPNREGTWQVLNGAHFDLEGATPTLGVPAGHGWVDGGAGSIPYQPAALAKKKENFAEASGARSCNPSALIGGIPRMTYMPYPFQIVQQADKVTFLIHLPKVSSPRSYERQPASRGADRFLAGRLTRSLGGEYPGR